MLDNKLAMVVASKAVALIQARRLSGTALNGVTKNCLYDAARGHGLMDRLPGKSDHEFTLKPKPAHAKTVNAAWKMIFEMGAWK